MNKPPTPRRIPKEQWDLFTTRVAALYPEDPPLGIPPGADENVMRITEDCLFMRSSAAKLFAGRGSMSWWGVWTSVFCFILITSIVLYSYYSPDMGILDNFFECCIRHVEYWLLVWMAPFVALCTFIPWRRSELPIIFNRKTRKMTFMFKGKVFTHDWDDLRAYIKDLTTVQPGAIRNEGTLTILTGRDPEKNKNVGVVIYATEHATEATGKRGIYGAGMIWEYIRLYMNEGASALPPFEPIVSKYRLQHIRETFHDFQPFGAFKDMLATKWYWWWFSWPCYLGLLIPFLILAIVADAIYMVIDRILPRRKWPREFLEACEHVWDGFHDYGPHRS